MTRDGRNLKQIGERLRKAREVAGITQADAAAETSMARTTLVAIEQGQRRVRMDEIQLLARLYKTSANALLRDEAVHVDLTPRFRKAINADDDGIHEAVTLLSDLARAEVELENILGIKRSFNYPQERPILPGDVRQQAEQDALELRQKLGLGLAPIRDMITLLEMDLGVRVYVRPINPAISGLFAYDDMLGACILLNARHPLARRNQSGSHEIGHLVATRRSPEVLLEHPFTNSREERYSDAFGRAFLTPGRAVMQKFHEVTAGAAQLTRRHVIILAHFFGVSREAIVRRLEELKLARDGTWDWFERNGKITDEHERQVLGDLKPADPHKAETDRPTTLRLAMLAAEAHHRELLTEGQLARMLKLDRVELRAMLDGLENEEGEADGQLQLK
ncbi:XRE family transcriptional regulator [Hyphomicrobium sp.]|uniref:helix-turn-helix domain-containing protein n=1 Tax=Hyphomicrobium sp. TaxID=82 RepID=UPI001D3B7393|nr:XRE family transcriptional regulator [Hyphomicrobium sp.]MBY0562428.1 XRE family transcriptional regulator [Hyphomicrobium sp.]